MHWRNLAHATFALTLLGAAACGPESTTPGGTAAPVTRAELEGSEYLLDSSHGFEPIAGTTVRLSFSDGWVSVHAGCNHIGGSYDLRRTTLIVTGTGTTEIGCDPARHEQDDWLASFLSSRPRMARNGDRLSLIGADATLTFLDREVADPDQPLAGAAWTIDTYLMNDGATNLPTSKDATVTFHADGSMEVDTTCNTSRGNYTVAGNTLTLTNIAYTERGCSGPALFAEKQVQAIIANGSLTFGIDARRLTLERGNIGLRALRKTEAEQPAGLTPAKLNGKHYLLERSEGFTPIASSKIHLIFDDGNLSFSAGCNSHSGPFELRGDTVIVHDFGSTLRGCAMDALAQDRWLAKFFTGEPRIAQDGDRLVFTGAEATLTFLDRELADPDQPLAGSAWIIDTFIKSDTASSGKGPNETGAPTITFSEDGTVLVFASCNRARGTYTVEGDTIILSALPYTEAWCSEAESIEEHVKAVMMEGAVRFQIEAGRLTLQRGDFGVSAMRSAAP